MQTIDQFYTDAGRKLTAYTQTGVAGFYQQAIDRLRVAGVAVDAFREASAANARHLLTWLTPTT